MDPAFIKAVIDGGVAVVLALVVIYWQRQDAKRQLADEKERTAEAKCERDKERERTDRMTQALEASAKAMTDLSGAIRELREAMERSGIDARIAGKAKA